MHDINEIAPYLIGIRDQPDLGFHQGVVVTWNSRDNTNSIDVAGQRVDDVVTLSTNDNVLMFPGDNVALLRFKSTFFILGRITLPGVTTSLGFRYDEIPDSESTSSTTVAHLATVGPTVTVEVGSSQRVLIHASVNMQIEPLSGMNVWLTYEGATSTGVGGGLPILNSINNDTAAQQSYDTSTFMLMDGTIGPTLNPGTTTFRLMYSVNDPADVGTFSARRLMVIPY